MIVYRRPLAAIVPVALGLGLLLAACGANGASTTSDGGPLIVSAASSLEPAFNAYADDGGIDARQSFAGSDDLAAQIRQGVTPDVYAAANTSLPDHLFKDDLVEKPKVFATNSLVLAVPKGSEISSLADVGKDGVTVASGDKGVPVGDYTREVLDRLPGSEASAILGNVRSQEPDVAGIVGKLTEGAVDAGFVYVTDVQATNGRLRAIPLPQKLQPDVAYGVAIVKGATNPGGAQAFINGLFSGDGKKALRAAGFGPPPG